jgi:hypothetical protein
VADTDLDASQGADTTDTSITTDAASGADAGDQAGADTGSADDGGQQADPIEALAQELGWTPKDQFKGDPDAWKPADQFIRDGRDITRSLSRELKEIRQNVGHIVQASTATLEQQIAEQKRLLETRHQEAVELGDPQTALQISRQITQLESRALAPVVPGEVAEFAERNKDWFQKDARATNFALAVADEEARLGRSPAEQVAAAEREVKKRFPELFLQVKAPPSVARPPSRAASSSNRAKTFHDMPAAAQEVANDMVARGAIPSVDLYVANYFKNERKVG